MSQMEAKRIFPGASARYWSVLMSPKKAGIKLCRDFP